MSISTHFRHARARHSSSNSSACQERGWRSWNVSLLHCDLMAVAQGPDPRMVPVGRSARPNPERIWMSVGWTFFLPVAQLQESFLLTFQLVTLIMLAACSIFVSHNLPAQLIAITECNLQLQKGRGVEGGIYPPRLFLIDPYPQSSVVLH